MSEPIPAWVREAVLRREGYRCLAPQLDGQAGWCRDVWGNVIPRWSHRDPGPARLQMSHTKEQGQLATGKKAPNAPDFIVALCPFHHTGTQAGSNWEAVHRNQIRDYLAQFSVPDPDTGRPRVLAT